MSLISLIVRTWKPDASEIILYVTMLFILKRIITAAIQQQYILQLRGTGRILCRDTWRSNYSPTTLVYTKGSRHLVNRSKRFFKKGEALLVIYIIGISRRRVDLRLAYSVGILYMGQNWYYCIINIISSWLDCIGPGIENDIFTRY